MLGIMSMIERSLEAILTRFQTHQGENTSDGSQIPTSAFAGSVNLGKLPNSVSPFLSYRIIVGQHFI